MTKSKKTEKTEVKPETYFKFESKNYECTNGKLNHLMEKQLGEENRFVCVYCRLRVVNAPSKELKKVKLSKIPQRK